MVTKKRKKIKSTKKEEIAKNKANRKFIPLNTPDDFDQWLNVTAESFQRREVDQKYMNTVANVVNVKRGFASAEELKHKVLEKINFIIIRLQNLFTQKFRNYKRIISKYVSPEILTQILMEFKESDKKIDKDMNEVENELFKIINKIKFINLDDIWMFSKGKIIELIKNLFNLLDPKSKQVVFDFMKDCMQDEE